MENDERAAAQEAFVSDEARVMVATNAFGMGIDKSDVRFVVNCGLPLSLEEYYQEAGRAGRDGEPAECYLLWSRGDIRTCHYFIDNTEFPPETPRAERETLLRNRERLLSAMIGYAMSDSCLRVRVLRYFGQDASTLGAGDSPAGCGGCSVCLGSSADEYLRAARPRRVFGATGFSGSYRTRELPSETEVTDEDERLFQRLRALRKQLADKYRVRPYMVFSDATLRAMVRVRPANVEELLRGLRRGTRQAPALRRRLSSRRSTGRTKGLRSGAKMTPERRFPTGFRTRQEPPAPDMAPEGLLQT
jgi:ATP-dependent DNA helicase RecQ